MRILGAHLHPATRYAGTSKGDVWTTTWADDGVLYTVSDDTEGFDRACSSNLAVSRLEGDDPLHLHGTTINPMSEYGDSSEFLEDGGMWKANGLICIDGVLYLSVSRHGNPLAGPFHIQQTWDASIVASHDHGASWSPMPTLGRSMFPGHTFGSPFFVQYGQNGQGAAHGADRYVYATSSDGVWNNGSSMTLGRVRRDRIGRLDAADWEFVHGYDEQGQPIWRGGHESARYTFRCPGRTSMTGIHYIAPLDVYLMPQWHYSHLEPYTNPRSWQHSQLDFYHAPTPWGPWTIFHSEEFDPQGWYNPCIVNRFTSEDGRTLWLFVAGDFATGATYCLHTIKLTLEIDD